MPQAMKIPAAKAAVDKEWEKLEKISAWNLTKVRSKKEVIDEARMSGATVHFASLMDICLLKNAELEAKHQIYKGRVVLRGDIVKDDSGSYAVFTEQGSSASQMTAAKIMDIISRLPGCDGQAADAVSAYTQVKMEDAHKLLKIPKPECPDIWIRLPRRKWPKSWSRDWLREEILPQCHLLSRFHSTVLRCCNRRSSPSINAWADWKLTRIGSHGSSLEACSRPPRSKKGCWRCACVHGINRLGGNSLLDWMVFGSVTRGACARYMLGDCTDIGSGTSCGPYSLAPCAHHVAPSTEYPACPTSE